MSMCRCLLVLSLILVLSHQTWAKTFSILFSSNKNFKRIPTDFDFCPLDFQLCRDDEFCLENRDFRGCVKKILLMENDFQLRKYFLRKRNSPMFTTDDDEWRRISLSHSHLRRPFDTKKLLLEHFLDGLTLEQVENLINQIPSEPTEKSLLTSTSKEKLHENLFNKTTNDETALINQQRYGSVLIDRDFQDDFEGYQVLSMVFQLNKWPKNLIHRWRVDHQLLMYDVMKNNHRINAENVTDSVINHQKLIEHQFHFRIINASIGQNREFPSDGSHSTLIASIFFVLGFLILIVVTLFCIIRNDQQIREKLTNSIDRSTRLKNPCRSLVDNSKRKKSSKKTAFATPMSKTTIIPESNQNENSFSNRSSTEEILQIENLDLNVAYSILVNLENRLNDRHWLTSTWKIFSQDIYKIDHHSFSIGLSEKNANKNRYIDAIPYDHSRIQLVDVDDGDDYINASPIFDSDRKCKYVATQGPMATTTNAFWQMIWEQGSTVIVALARPIENGSTMSHHYWPIDDSVRFEDFEIHLISEYLWSEDYLSRSFYLKNLQTMETRTVTQFHFLTWEEFNNPPSTKALLDFRRKVRACQNGQHSPIVVHCNDGTGRTGTFILLDLVLNEIGKGTKQINISNTLVELRVQRAKMVKTKEQFEFVFVAVAEEIDRQLKSIS